MVRTAMFCAVFLLVQVAFAQSSEIPEPEARQHVTHQANPVYPPIARAAQVQGQVVLAVVIDANGAVSSERVVSGPPMLQQAALDAVKNWEFSPFMANNAPISVATTLTLSFQIEQNGPAPNPEQQRAAQALFPLSDKCRSALRAGDTQNALDYCKQALDMSFKAGDLTSSDQLGRLDAHQLYGHALLLAGKPNEALEQENLAIQEAKKCLTDTDQEYGWPFFWRAIVEAHLGRNDASLADFAVAETTQKKAIQNLPDMKVEYTRELAAILKQHAALLDLMGRTDEAAKLRAEAAAP